MRINDKTINARHLLSLVARASKPIGLVTGEGSGVMREDNILRIHQNHQLVAAHVYPDEAAAKREMARLY